MVYNWQYVHCLNMWSEVLCRVSHSSLRPLIYPLVQITLGTLQVQPSAKYHPLRLHLVKMLLQLSRSTNTYIPVASYLLEVRPFHPYHGGREDNTMPGIALDAGHTHAMEAWGGGGGAHPHAMEPRPRGGCITLERVHLCM